MTPDEVVAAMDAIQKTSALFDWLEMFDSHQCEASYEMLMASTCELTISKADYNDLLGMG